MGSSEAMELRGIAWDHQRGVGVLRDTLPYYEDPNGVSVTWETRTLQEFADAPVDVLSESYDLLVIDHPFVGRAHTRRCFLPMESHLPTGFLEGQAANSVGASHASYQWAGHQYALALDAAGHVSAWRDDIVDERELTTWNEVLSTAERLRQDGRPMGLPFVPIDALMCLLSLCANFGAAPFSTRNQIVDPQVGERALELLSQLLLLSHPDSLDWNPIAAFEAMESGEVSFCPLTFGYSNYAKRVDTPIRCGLIPSAGFGRVGGILGGAGLAISSHCRHPAAAARYCSWLTSAPVQSGVYVEHGGQPGHRAAWSQAQGAESTSPYRYFADTLPALDSSYLRPRFDGFTYFQDLAGPVIREAVKRGTTPAATLDKLNELRILCELGIDPANPEQSNGGS